MCFTAPSVAGTRSNPVKYADEDSSRRRGNSGSSRDASAKLAKLRLEDNSDSEVGDVLYLGDKWPAASMKPGVFRGRGLLKFWKQAALVDPPPPALLWHTLISLMSHDASCCHAMRSPLCRMHMWRVGLLVAPPTLLPPSRSLSLSFRNLLSRAQGCC